MQYANAAYYQEFFMQILVDRLVANVGVTDEQARRAISVIVGFLRDAGPRAEVGRLMEALPGAAEVEPPRGKSFAGMMGAMSAFNALTSAGLDMGEIQAVTREFVAFGKENAGDELVDDVISSIPGLSQFV